tara:strand:- start:808 stop:1170 length:363 start_codon:yes stop_codon:yes gene_type:complete
MNNFITGDRPLGWEYGSDCEKINYGINYFNQDNLWFNLNYGKIKIGEESILNRPFDTWVDHDKGPFPSGEIIKKNYLVLTSLVKINQSYFLTFKSRCIYPDFSWKDQFYLSIGMEYVFDR